MKRIFAVVSLVVAASLMQGCATGATVAGMSSLQKLDTTHSKLAGQISVTQASGGQKTNPLWTSQVESATFEQALQASLAANGLLAPAAGNYVLKPTLQQLKQPLFGLDLTVTADVHYLLKEQATGKILLNEIIQSSHTATVGDSFAAVKRLRLANEGAIRNNIDQLLKRLAGLLPN